MANRALPHGRRGCSGVKFPTFPRPNSIFFLFLTAGPHVKGAGSWVQGLELNAVAFRV